MANYAGLSKHKNSVLAILSLCVQSCEVEKQRSKYLWIITNNNNKYFQINKYFYSYQFSRYYPVFMLIQYFIKEKLIRSKSFVAVFFAHFT